MNKRACFVLLLLWLAFRATASAWYDPTTKSFLSRDPIREAGGINLYAYCGNDPVGRHDPIGLSVELNLDGTAAFYTDSYASYRGMQDYLQSPLGTGEFILQMASEEFDGLNRAAEYLGKDEAHRLLLLQGQIPRLRRFVTYERNRLAAASQFGDTLAAEMEAARNTPGWSWLGLEGEIADIRAIGIGIGAIKNPRFGDYFMAALNSPFAYSRAVTLGIDIGLSLTGLPEGTITSRDGIIRQTGAGDMFGSADEAYATIRASTTDVALIAETTGFKVSNIQKIKDHVFMNEHLLNL